MKGPEQPKKHWADYLRRALRLNDQPIGLPPTPTAAITRDALECLMLVDGSRLLEIDLQFRGIAQVRVRTATYETDAIIGSR